jgi:hypothetical protein
MRHVSALIATVSIAVIGCLLGVYYTYRRNRDRTGTVPASRLQKELGLYAENWGPVALDPAQVSADLRNLIPYAQKWGIGDASIRNDLIDKATAAEKQEFHDALYESDARVTEWLNSFPAGELTDEAEAFMHMQEALAEMGFFLDEEKSGQAAQPYPEPPNHIGPKRIEPIPAALFEKLARITPSRDGDMLYYPCRVVTRDGRAFDRVYVEPREPYLTRWGVLPFDDRHKGWIAISEIVDLEESPFRLPPHLADKVYRWGESGMGYCRFRVGFRGWKKSTVVTGNAVDFIPLPEGATGADVVRVHPPADRDGPSEQAPRYYWSIYEGVGPG